MNFHTTWCRSEKVTVHRVSSNITILFHGPDEESLLPFIRSQGVEGRWEELVCCIVDTQGFFDMLGCQKTGMQSIVKTYGSKADKELFKEEAHSSLWIL
jgi:hypothetical protein